MIKQVLNIEMKPKRIERIILNEMKEGIKIQKLVIQKDFMETCLRRKICPVEISSLAKKVHQSDGHGRRIKDRDTQEEKRILNLRIEKKKEEIQTMKDAWTEESKRVRHVSRLSKDGEWRLKKIKNEELSRGWEKEKERMKKKLRI